MDFYEGSSIIKSRSEVGHLKNGGGGLFIAMMHFRNTQLTDVVIAFSVSFRTAAAMQIDLNAVGGR
jgi:hypothetical protein